MDGQTAFGSSVDRSSPLDGRVEESGAQQLTATPRLARHMSRKESRRKSLVRLSSLISRDTHDAGPRRDLQRSISK